MRTALKKATTALTLASVIALSAPAMAGPVPGNLASIAAATPQHITDVRWRGRGAGVAAGIAAGVITGAIIAGAARPYYYGPGPYVVPGPYYYAPRYYRYRAPVYIEPPPVYIEPPAVYGPRGGGYGPRRQCWVSTDNDRGYGYWQPC